MTLELFGEVLILAFLSIITIGAFIFVWAMAESTGLNNKKSRFDWVYSKLLYSYKIKVLHDELKLRDVKLEDL